MTTTATYNKVKTNIAWMPELPEHWKLCRGKNLFIEKSIKDYPNEPLLAASQKQGVVLKTMLDQKSMEALQNFETFKLVDINDFVISLRSFEGGIEIAHYRGIISPVYNIFNFRNADHYCYEYFKYLFKSNMFIQELNIYKKGIRDGQSISYREFANITFPIPPHQEQIIIADFLEKQSQKINHFIAKKQQFIALLKEQRQSVINEAVTKGINKKVKLKDSGIQWLGNIPEHWEVRKLKYCVTLNSNEIDIENIETDLKKIALENIDNWTGRFVETGNPTFEGKGNYFKTGDVLFNKLRPYLAKAFIAEENGIAVNELLILTPNENSFTSQFLFQRLMTSDFIDVVNSSTYGAKMPRANWTFIGNLKLPIPPLTEQTQIVNHIKTETTTIDTAIAKTEREIELIKEYKEAMIAEAVMGKVNFNKK